jgi:hypothetical protein
MRTGRRVGLAIALAFLVGACGPNVPSPSARLGYRALPIDVSLTPLSLSALAAADAAALDLCVGREDRGQVAGAAWLASARDVGKYTPTNGNEPELQAAGRVFLVQLQGKIFTRRGEVVDPVCMIQNGTKTLFVPYDDAGNPVRFGGMRLPTLSLPPLEP